MKVFRWFFLRILARQIIMGLTAIVFFLLLTDSTTFAQQSELITINGEVLNSFGDPVAGVSVYISGMKNAGTTTDSAGNFSIKAKTSGKLIVVASSVGYRTIEREIYIKPGQKVDLQLSLADDQKQLNEVSIKGIGKNQYAIKQLKESGFNVNVIDANEFRNTATDINQILKKTTGVLIR
ncbi:MAG: carboxypeptidase-like regulatory domain-containing protein, partial [Sphingobacteriaceae bacterium]